jgi:histidinol phosphatase-like PHP family hydrolase
MGGTSWFDVKTFNRADHFPDFALRKTGNTAMWEFSLIVYNDTYKETNKEAARVALAPNKILGLSVAYCDDDHPEKNPNVRDYMFGSVHEPNPGNLHWKNADYFGRMRLTSAIRSGDH